MADSFIPLQYDYMPPVPSFTLVSDDMTDGQPTGGRPGERDVRCARRYRHVAPPALGGSAGRHAQLRHHLPRPGGADGQRVLALDGVRHPGVGHRDRHRRRFAGRRRPAVGCRQSRNDANLLGFVGAGPPPGHGPHRYVFAVHALDVEKTGATVDSMPAYVGFTMFGHTLARALLTATFER